MKRDSTVVPAAVALGTLLFLTGGCASVPPNPVPQDPFLPADPGPPPQQNLRPQYPPPLFQPFPQQRFDPRYQPVPQSPYRPAPPRGTPTPLRPSLENPTTTPDESSPKTFSTPTPNGSVPPPRSAPNTAPLFRPERQRSDKMPTPYRPAPQVPPAQVPRKQPAPMTPDASDGPTLFPPEDAPTASRTSLPKFAAKDTAVELIVVAPERRPVGSGAPFQLTIKNTGNDVLRNLLVTCEFDEALTFPGSDRKSVTHKIPKIEGRDARESLLTLVSDRPGVFQCRFQVEAGGKTVVAKTVAVEFVSRQLDWQIHGPTERTVGSRAEFNIPLINITNRPLNNLVVRVDLDSALTVREMTQGGRLGDRSVTWTIDRLTANEGMLLQLEVECHEPTTQACLYVTVSGDDVPADDAEACLTVKPVVGMLDVRVHDVADPVASGEEVELIIALENQGLQPARDIAVACQWPDGFQFLGAELVHEGQSSAVKATVQDQSAALPVVPRLETDQKVAFRVKLSAGRAGAHQLKVTVTHNGNASPHEVIEPIMVHR